MDQTTMFEGERPRLVGVAARVLGDRHEAEDIVQRTWLRLRANTTELDNPPAWLTTVTVRLCIDRLRELTPLPREVGDDTAIDAGGIAGGAPRTSDPLESVETTEAVGQALHVVVERLSPNERVALVLHESFGYDFDTIGEILDRSPAAARKLASRARGKVATAEQGGPVSDRHIVDAFMTAARGGDLGRLLALLAPDAIIRADEAAIAIGTPRLIEGREAVAGFFDGSAKATLATQIDGRPGAAWFRRGQAMVAFDFTIVDGAVQSVTFRADPGVLARVHRRSTPVT
ncbi:sigma-70 family RNA polymerase sigma factor [Herbiconiux flava]|uniref:RNA polymerase sigma-70 factor (ECF subfamily) n=1 Tax=Herbiconiux flava TaxID=881268 RepID=A0A852SRK0_9MICO|nr:sigma-70 family RNA polymerase sigma factor [Herbiconiux flava]NYD71344.1 RNA polymerase sigma-70 factor (ECF subfamily) [Herbiconiux flava]GLK18692.1 DNA-directed RNA polymerase sigma-70 factor [Herbiconiux flava]